MIHFLDYLPAIRFVCQHNLFLLVVLCAHSSWQWGLGVARSRVGGDYGRKPSGTNKRVLWYIVRQIGGKASVKGGARWLGA